MIKQRSILFSAARVKVNMSNWVEYTGSDEQTAEIKKAANHNGILLKFNNGEFLNVILKGEKEVLDHFDKRSKYQPSHYLICNPHPLADMICQQARTGQSVWIKHPDTKYDWDGILGNIIVDYISITMTTIPNWNITNAEYSFTPFEDK